MASCISPLGEIQDAVEPAKAYLNTLRLSSGYPPRIQPRPYGCGFLRRRVIADEFEISGWAKNEEDGSVKIVAEEEEDNLQKLAEWCKKGTEWSRVENVEINWLDATEEFNGFKIL